MSDLTRLTPLLIVAIPLILGLIDVCLYYFGGNDATFSRVMLNLSKNRPLVALSTAYSFGILMGHFFFPTWTERSPPTYEVLARLVVVLSPTFYAMIIIGAGNGVAKMHDEVLEAGGQWPMVGYVLFGFVAGGVAGKFALPQHICP